MKNKKNKNLFLITGIFAFAVSIILRFLFNENDSIIYISGLLAALSIVLNTVFVVNYLRQPSGR